MILVKMVSDTPSRSLTSPNIFYSIDSDLETETTVVRPWAPTTIPTNGSTPTVDQYNTKTEDTDDPNSPSIALALRSLFELITEDLDKFVYTPAPNGLGDIQCRITRDKRGMEKGLFPTYYMHVERPGDGKKVCDRKSR